MLVPVDEPATVKPAPRQVPAKTIPADSLETYYPSYPDYQAPVIRTVPPQAGPIHVRHPFYSYRAPWFTPGPASLNVTIVW